MLCFNQKNMGRKQPLFFLAKFSLLFFVTGLIAFFCFFDQERQILPEKNYFVQSHYLFPKTEEITDFDFNVSEEAFLSSGGPPFLFSGRSLASFRNPSLVQEVTNYIAAQGDTVSSLAAQFSISEETILWANNLSKSSTLKPGEKLVILPVSGALHIVGPGDTLSAISLAYEADSEDIIEINGLSEDGAIFAGDMLIIPGGIKPKKSFNYAQVLLPGNYFICPIPAPCKVTQGLHWYNALDFSNGQCGEPVFAAAGGAVQRTGYGNVSGNYVRVEHSNGVVTFYGHLSKFTVSAGQKVSQGQVLGYVGYTGQTIPAGPTGCHLHFDVRFAVNPFAAFGAGAELGRQ